MPEISRFHGIVIAMFYPEHGPPHFHARRGEYKLRVDIRSLSAAGEFPETDRRRVTVWAALHQEDLLRNWQRARRGERLLPVPPLE